MKKLILSIFAIAALSGCTVIDKAISKGLTAANVPTSMSVDLGVKPIYEETSPFPPAMYSPWGEDSYVQPVMSQCVAAQLVVQKMAKNMSMYELLVNPQKYTHGADAPGKISRACSGDTIPRISTIKGESDHIDIQVYKRDGLVIVDAAESFLFPGCTAEMTIGGNMMPGGRQCYFNQADGFRHRLIINPATGVMTGISYDQEAVKAPVMAWFGPALNTSEIKPLVAQIQINIENMGNRAKMLRNAKNKLDLCDASKVVTTDWSDGKDRAKRELLSGKDRNEFLLGTAKVVGNASGNLYCKMDEADRAAYLEMVKKDVIDAAKTMSADALKELGAKAVSTAKD